MRRDQGRARTVNGAPLRRARAASSAVRGLAHCLHGATQEPHAERRRLGGDRDPRPCEVFHAAMLGACPSGVCLVLGRRGICRRSIRPGSRRSRDASRGPGGGAGLPVGGFGSGAGGAGVATARASHSRPSAGQVAEHASLVRGVLASGRLGRSLLLVGHERVFHRAERTHAAERRNSGPSTVFLGEHPALGPASAWAGIDAASRFFPAHKRGNT
jgi:hypothetical protein